MDLREQIARALAVAAHKHILGAARWQKWLPDAAAALAAIEASGTHVVVPVEPTNEMRFVATSEPPGGGDRYLRQYRAMIAARPIP